MDTVCMRAVPQDLEALLALEESSFACGDRWSREGMLAELERDGSLVLTARQADRTVGFAAVRELLGEAELLKIAVAPEWRGAGIGKMLLEAVLKAYPPETVWRLDVRESNLPAQALYRRFGFRTAALNRGFYAGPRENGLLMLREFTENDPLEPGGV